MILSGSAPAVKCCFNKRFEHDRRNQGAQGGICPHFSKTEAKCLFPCNVIALHENLKMQI